VNGAQHFLDTLDLKEAKALLEELGA